MTNNTTKTSKNYHSITFNKDTKTISITWMRSPIEIERIYKNLNLFQITPSEKLMKQIEKISLQKTSSEITDIFSI